MRDLVVDNVIDKYYERSNVGITKYGSTLYMNNHDDYLKHLQEELVDTEDKIQASRRFYNGSARDLNIKIKTFPNNLFANNLGFKEREFFELDDTEAAIAEKPVEVKF